METLKVGLSVGIILIGVVLIYELVQTQQEIEPLSHLAEDINTLTNFVKKIGG